MFFLFQGAFGDEAEFNQKVVEYGAIPYEVSHPGEYCNVEGQQLVCGGDAPGQPSTWLTILTSMFMHGGLLHLGGNMLFLWIFGNNIEDSMGPLRFIAFYLLGGVGRRGGTDGRSIRRRPFPRSGPAGPWRPCLAVTRCSIHARAWSHCCSS